MSPDSGLRVRERGCARVKIRPVNFSLSKISCSLEKSMTQEEQVDAFTFELDNLIDRYTQEFDLTLASVIGVLECMKLEIWDDSRGAQYAEERK